MCVYNRPNNNVKTCSMWYFANMITVSTYIDVFQWDLDTIIIG